MIESIECGVTEVEQLWQFSTDHLGLKLYMYIPFTLLKRLCLYYHVMYLFLSNYHSDMILKIFCHQNHKQCRKSNVMVVRQEKLLKVTLFSPITAAFNTVLSSSSTIIVSIQFNRAPSSNKNYQFNLLFNRKYITKYLYHIITL